MPSRTRRDPYADLLEALTAQAALLVEALAATPGDALTGRHGRSARELDEQLGASMARLVPSAHPDAGRSGLAEAAACLVPGAGEPPAQEVRRVLLELVVCGRDLPEPVPPDRRALRLAVKALAELLAERAPGKHVEARIPPYAAVQCVEGPRHTRGTPPNVVEADPVAFVELCTGRLAWADAAADGRVRTWGDRADLSPWLPLLP